MWPVPVQSAMSMAVQAAMGLEGRYASDRAYWHPKRDPSEVIPRGSVIGVFSDGVSKVTAGTPLVGVVPHTPDKVPKHLPTTETRNPDGTYSSNQHCLMAFVGEVPVRVAADFVVPKVISGVLFLMPSGKNDGLATVHDGSGRILGYMKPSSQVWQTDAGHFVTCCMGFAGGASMPHANASNHSLPVRRRLRPRTTKGTRNGHGRRNSGDIPAQPTARGWGVESEVMRLLNGCSKAAVKAVLIGFLPWLFSLIVSIQVGLDSVKFDGCDKPANASYDVGFSQYGDWFSYNVTGRPGLLPCSFPDHPDSAGGLQIARFVFLALPWVVQFFPRWAAWTLSVVIWEAAVTACCVMAVFLSLVTFQAFFPVPQTEFVWTLFVPRWICLFSFSALSALSAFIIAWGIALLLLRVPPASWCVTMVAEILSRLLLLAANFAKFAIMGFRRCRNLRATVPGYVELSTFSDSGSSDSESYSEAETQLPPDPDAVGASAV
jgi:hypothetical protein